MNAKNIIIVGWNISHILNLLNSFKMVSNHNGISARRHRSSLDLIRKENAATPKHEFGWVNWIIWDV